MWVRDYVTFLGLLALTVLVSTGHVSGADHSSNQTSTESTLGADLGQDEGSGEVDGGIFNVTKANATEVHPELIIREADGNPCLLANINASIKISYTVSEGLVHQTYFATSHIQMPEDVATEGFCGVNSSNLILTWNNDTVQFNMTFSKMQKVNNWTLSAISVVYNLSNTEMFPGASEAHLVTVESDRLKLFSTELGVTKQCSHDVTVFLGSYDHKVDVTFHDVQLAAYNLSSAEFPTEKSYCTEKDSVRMDDDILVPLIVACCLSLIVIVVVVAYAISRKVQEAREQTQYKPMP